MNSNKVVIHVGRGCPAKGAFLAFDKQAGKEAVYCWAKPNLHNNAFTLIELLVVVLIIGILAAVALPQYQLAVDKARFAKLENMANAVVKAEESYYLANGTYAKDWNEIDITFPGTIRSSGAYSNARINSADGWQADLSISKANSGMIDGVILTDDLLKDIEMYFSYQHSRWNGKRACYAVRTNARAIRLCQNVSNRKTRNDSSGEKDIYWF